ncbi:hypothetical protein OH76DRAFT_1407915 [Lentinus brumalis]|uniref:Uncharacterized protein n=1 Tax=Lentinus brumalis TaxID=2498619 RepID=A0A371CZ12_9APHY|nr:hypothetical protein OH76DRAFT_1407915 [Polyporus brumalis]
MSSSSATSPSSPSCLQLSLDHGVTTHSGSPSYTEPQRVGDPQLNREDPRRDHDHSSSASPEPEPQTVVVKAPQSPSSPSFPLKPAVFPAKPTTSLVVPIPFGSRVEPDYVLRVMSQEKRGLSLAELCIAGQDGELRADLWSIKKLVDWQDLCVCSQVPGPTVRVADVGREWPGTVLYLPGCPVPKTTDRCFVYAKLVWYVLEHFLDWWTCEVQEHTSVESASRTGHAPGAVQLHQVFLVALRRRHIALDVYEWLPELELRL